MTFFQSSTSETQLSDFKYATTGKCVPGVLWRLPCFHGHATHHRIKESTELRCTLANPGIVAKLMGLDSMPLELRKKGTRVLEAPRFVELENDKFIILSFEGGGKDKELKLNSSKKRNNKKNQESPICQSPKNSCELFNLKAEFDSKKPCETESDSEKSSPVSVLEFPNHHQVASHSGKEDLKPKNSNLRRKLRGVLDKNAPSSSSKSSYNSTNIGVESTKTGKKCVGLNKNNFRIRDFNEMWEEVSKMAERDTIERWKGEDIEEIGVCFGLQILDQLILELFTIT